MSVRVPDERLDELAALAAKATPGPWYGNENTHIVCDAEPQPVVRIVIAQEDVEFIAAAGTDLAALVADLRAARADNQRLRLAEAVAETAFALACHDAGCIIAACLHRDGCAERAELFAAHENAVTKWVAATGREWPALAEEPRA